MLEYAQLIDQSLKYPRLTPAQQIEACIKAQSGDQKSRDALVKSCLRLVITASRKFRANGVETADLVQAGNIGMLSAIAGYDPSRNVPFHAWAMKWIRAEMFKVVGAAHPVKHGGNVARTLLYRFNRERKTLEGLGEQADTAAMAARLGCEEREVEEIESRLRPLVSLNAMATKDSSTVTLQDLLQGNQDIASDLEREERNQEIREKIEAFAASLKPNEIAVFRHRLLTDEPMGLREIGDALQISHERVRQIEVKLRSKLAQQLAQYAPKGATAPARIYKAGVTRKAAA